MHSQQCKFPRNTTSCARRPSSQQYNVYLTDLFEMEIMNQIIIGSNLKQKLRLISIFRYKYYCVIGLKLIEPVISIVLIGTGSYLESTDVPRLY